MNNEKITTQQITLAFAQKTGKTKKYSDQFLHDFVQQMHDALIEDGFCKIRGLGTLRLQWTDSRKSVNVQTGETFEIEGHYKVVFTPEPEMKDFVNKPYAHLENVNLDDEDIQVDEQQTEVELKRKFTNDVSIVSGLLSEINSMSTATPIAEMSQSTEKDEIEAGVDLNRTEDVVVEQSFISTNEEKKQVLDEEEAMEEEGEIETDNDNEDKQPHKSKKIVWILLVLLLLLGQFVWAWIYFSEKEKDSYEKPKQIEKTAAEEYKNVDENVPEQTIPYVDYNEDEQRQEVMESQQEEMEEDICASMYPDFDFENCEADLKTVGEGGRLAWYATQYYGDYRFWPYIYQANKSQLGTPNNLEKGQVLRIPKLPAEMIDTTNEKVLRWCEECLKN